MSEKSLIIAEMVAEALENKGSLHEGMPAVFETYPKTTTPATQAEWDAKSESLQAQES